MSLRAWGRSVVRALAPPRAAAPRSAPPTARLDFEGCEIRIAVTSESERRWRASPGAKEPWTVEWIVDRIQPGDVLYDIGANVGAFSLIAARARGATVVAFEPGYATYARLCENVQLNGCQHQIVPVPLALSERSGIVGLEYRSLEPGQSRHHMREAAWSPEDSSGRKRYVQPICSIALDAAVAEFRLPPPAFLKIDVDGAEERVLRGAAATLSRPGLRSVLVEIDRERFDAVTGILTGHGLVLEKRMERKRKATSPVYAVFGRP